MKCRICETTSYPIEEMFVDDNGLLCPVCETNLRIKRSKLLEKCIDVVSRDKSLRSNVINKRRR